MLDIKQNQVFSANRVLYEKQMKMLKDMLEKNAITEEQYNVSAGGLVRKMEHGKMLSEMSNEELWFMFPIILSEHNPNWFNWYKDEYTYLKKILPQNEIIRISHIGSTAISTIKAKSIVDILVEAVPGSDLCEIQKIIENNGYRFMYKDKNRISFNKGYTQKGFSTKVFHLHLRYVGDNDELYFCDYLKENYKIAKEYEILKTELQKKYTYNRDAYTIAKTDFIKSITKKAKALYKERYKN